MVEDNKKRNEQDFEERSKRIIYALREAHTSEEKKSMLPQLKTLVKDMKMAGINKDSVVRLSVEDIYSILKRA